MAKQLPSSAPVYLMLQATTLNELGGVYASTNEFSEASKVYEEALAMFRRMPKDDPTTGLLGIAEVQHNLGITYANLGKFSQSEEADREAIGIYRQLGSVTGHRGRYASPPTKRSTTLSPGRGTPIVRVFNRTLRYGFCDRDRWADLWSLTDFG